MTTLLPLEQLAYGIVLHLNLGNADSLRRLDERTPDVVVAYQRVLVRRARFVSETERGRVRGIGHREHDVRAWRWAFARQLTAECPSRPIDGATEHGAVRSSEIHMLEDAPMDWGRRQRMDRAETLRIDRNDLAGLHFAFVHGANDVEGAGFRREDPAVTQPSHDERAPAVRIARDEHRIVQYDQQAVRTFDPL